MLDSYLDQVKDMLNAEDMQAKCQMYAFDENITWPRSDRQIILNKETVIELGHPQTESLSFLMWTTSPEKINDNYIRIIGPDLKQMANKQMPFGKIVLVKVHDFDEHNTYQRFEEMDLFKFKAQLEGCMLRSVPQDCKEWSRVSKTALKSGFSLQIMGNELIRDLKNLEFVDEVEVIFITSNKDDVQKFQPIGKKVNEVTRAMNKIFDNLEYDCAHCDFSDVCKEVDGLIEMHQNQTNQISL